MTRLATIVATTCTVVGMVLGVGYAFGADTGVGTGARWLVFPLLAVAGAHLLLGPTALIAAASSGNALRLWWVFGYFLIGTPGLSGCSWAPRRGAPPPTS